MLYVFGIWKATAIDARSDFSKVVDGSRMWRGRTRVLDAEIALGVELFPMIWRGGDQRAMSLDNCLLELGVHADGWRLDGEKSMIQSIIALKATIW